MKFNVLTKGLVVATGVGVLTIGSLVYTGSEIIDLAKTKLTTQETMLQSYETNEMALATKIRELKIKIADLQEQLESNNADVEQIEQLQSQITALQEQLAQAEQDLQESQTEAERLASELTKANSKAEELNSVLQGLTFNDAPMTTEEMEELTGEATNKPVASITWNTSTSPLYKETEQQFIDKHKEAITSLLTDAEVSPEGITIAVNIQSVMSSTNYIQLNIKGASAEAKAILTKDKINTKISDNKNYINKVAFS